MPWAYLRCKQCGTKDVRWQENLENLPCECGGELVWKRAIYGAPPSGRNAQGFTPCVLFRDPSAPPGQYRVPGFVGEETPQGFEKIEIKSIKEWEGVTRQMSAYGRAIAERAYHERQQAIDIVKKEIHAELREQMKEWRLSDVPPEYAEQAAATLKFAEYALEHSERKRPRPMPSGEVIAHALEYSASNREPWRDERTEWKGKRS